MNILDAITGMTGQQRTAALRDLGRRAEYYVPPELRGILGFAAEMTPSETLSRAGAAGREMTAPGRTPMQRVGSAGQMLSETAAVAAPAAVAGRAAMPAAQAVQEAFMGFSVPARAAGEAVLARANQPGPVPTMYSNPVGRSADDAPQGILAYHGSPHDFDRFSMEKIGTGEGAQAYGHGLYFAEAEPVARGYRDALTAQNASAAQRSLAYRNGDVAAAIDDAKRKIAIYSEKVKDHNAPDLAHRLLQINKQKLADLEAGAQPSGHMYEVNIAANPEDFLDWDKPLSEQPKKVQDFANARWQQIYGRNPDPSIEGEYIAKMASPQHGIDDLKWLDTSPAADQAARLREAGIPGIKYLDQGSRAAGEGSRNYVVFDENLINIIRKYGIAGAAAMLGMSQADLAQAMQSQQQQQPQGLLGGPQ